MLPPSAQRWLFSEAAIGESWTSYVVVANPNPASATVRVGWPGEARQADERGFSIPAMGRVSVEAPRGATGQLPAAEIVADQPVAVVRSAYERGGVGTVTQAGSPQRTG